MNNHNSQRGFSFIELLIAMTVTIVIAGIASTLVAQSFRMRAREDARSDEVIFDGIAHPIKDYGS